MLKFAKSVPYLPDPERSRPHITDEQRRLAAAEPPQPVPFHCKPWVDGQTVGWTLSYGYLTTITIVGQSDGRIEVEQLDELARETNQAHIVDQFAPGHFGLGSGYSLHTPPGFVTLLIPAAQPVAGLNLVTGVVESDWYARQLFLVFAVPDAGRRVTLEHRMPLARVVVIPRHEGLAATPLDSDELAAYQAREAAYLAEEQMTPARWQAATGEWFTHLYKEWSQRYRRAGGDPARLVDP